MISQKISSFLILARLTITHASKINIFLLWKDLLAYYLAWNIEHADTNIDEVCLNFLK